MVEEMIPALARVKERGNLASIKLVDVFVEDGVFSVESGERILCAPRRLFCRGTFTAMNLVSNMQESFHRVGLLVIWSISEMKALRLWRRVEQQLLYCRRHRLCFAFRHPLTRKNSLTAVFRLRCGQISIRTRSVYLCHIPCFWLARQRGHYRFRFDPRLGPDGDALRTVTKLVLLLVDD